MNKALKIVGYAAGSLVGITAAYLATSFVLSRIPVNKDDLHDEGDVEIYILSNGAHTDIVVPLRTPEMDWSQFISVENTLAKDPDMNFLAIGWGDKGFYLETPTWAELKPSTAFKAAFFLSSSAMHTTFYKEMHEGEKCVKIHISYAEYDCLIKYIKDSFDYDAHGNIEWIAGHSYGQDDSFYEAKRVYSIFYTCNTWANDALKYCGQKASLWTAFDTGIFYQYRHKE